MIVLGSEPGDTVMTLGYSLVGIVMVCVESAGMVMVLPMESVVVTPDGPPTMTTTDGPLLGYAD